VYASRLLDFDSSLPSLPFSFTHHSHHSHFIPSSPSSLWPSSELKASLVVHWNHQSYLRLHAHFTAQVNLVVFQILTVGSACAAPTDPAFSSDPSSDRKITMSQSRDSSSTSDDPDAMAAHLLAQFQSASSRQTSVMAPQGSEDALQPVQQVTGNSEEPTKSFEILVPVVNNPEDYEYLPGHFEVHRILAVDMHEPKLIVRLKSGERQTVSEHYQLVNQSQAPFN
jgi:hypothetical protein